MNVCKMTITGNLGRDPEMRQAGSHQVCNFSVGVNDEWFNISVWGKQGEACAQYLKKGRPVYVDGDFSKREYDKKDGTKGLSLDINAQKVVFLPSPKDAVAPTVDETEEIPF